jgi:hypothetical protein
MKIWITVILSGLLPCFVFCQDTLSFHKPFDPQYGKMEKVHDVRWNISVGYLQPVGTWAEQMDFDHSSKLLGGACHALWGINASIGKTIIRHRRKREPLNGMGIIFTPLRFEMISYDLHSYNGPTFVSKQINPFYIYGISFGPFYDFQIGNKSRLTFFMQLGFALEFTKGNIIYERSNFSYPVYTPNYTGNDKYIYSEDYSFKGKGGSFASGIKYESGNFGIGFEMQWELMIGTYSGGSVYHDYFGNAFKEAESGLNNCLLFNSSLNLFLSYSFGK